MALSERERSEEEASISLSAARLGSLELVNYDLRFASTSAHLSLSSVIVILTRMPRWCSAHQSDSGGKVVAKDEWRDGAALTVAKKAAEGLKREIKSINVRHETVLRELKRTEKRWNKAHALVEEEETLRLRAADVTKRCIAEEERIQAMCRERNVVHRA